MQVQNIDDTKKGLKKGVSMPFNINNIDVTVSANTIYGITSGILSGTLSPELFDQDIQVMFLTRELYTTRLLWTFLKWEIAKKMYCREPQ